MFSSFQLPENIGGEKIVKPLREVALPNGIATTQIVPVQTTGLTSERKRVPTIGEAFSAPPLSLPIPKPSKNATTRASTVGWYQPSASEPVSSRNSSYFRQPISTGQWLDYTNAGPPQTGKKRQRERGMSFSASKSPLSDTDKAEIESAKLDALFRGAYSGFAPTRDDSAAVAPEGIINRIWWQRTGEKNFERLVKNSVHDDVEAQEKAETGSITDNEMEEFRKMVEEWGPEAIDPNLDNTDAQAEKSIHEKEVDEILEEISGLIETLYSYQRIRHLSLNAPNRPMGLLSAPDMKNIGTPSTPSEAEVATYEILKSQLALMISSLPPYAVAKLNSDQLSELNISTKIEIQVEDYKGVMEEDEAAARAKVAALNAASSSARPTPSLSRTSSAALYGNQYSQSPRPAGSHQYYGSTQTPMRQSGSNLQRPPSATPMPYTAPRPSSTTPYRPTYGTPTYPHQSSRPGQLQYTPSTAQYLSAASGQNYARTPNQPYQHPVPPSSMGPVRYPSQPYASSQGQNPINYPYGNGTGINRQGSPQKPMSYSPQPAPVPNRPYGTPTPGTPGSRPYQSSSVTQGPVTNGSTTHPATPYSTFMTAEQTNSLIERQRAQLAQQQGAQQQARNAAQAGAMSVSPAPQVNGGSPVAAGS